MSGEELKIAGEVLVGNTTSSKITKNILLKTNEISSQIQEILSVENGKLVIGDNLDGIKKALLSLFRTVIFDPNNSQFLTDYLEGPDINEEKLLNKLGRNLEVFLEIIIGSMKSKLNLDNLNSPIIKRSISISIVKILDILFIFGDKFNFSALKSLLNFDRKVISDIKKTFSEQFYKIKEKEKEKIEERKKEGELDQEKDGEGEIIDLKDTLDNRGYLSSAYKVAHKRAYIQYLNENKNAKEIDEGKIKKYISDNILEEIRILFNNLYNLYKIICDLKNTDLELRLKEVKKALNILIGYIDILKQLDILVLDDNGKNIFDSNNPNYVSGLSKYFIDGFNSADSINPIFITFLKDESKDLHETRNAINNKASIDEDLSSSEADNSKEDTFDLRVDSLKEWRRLRMTSRYKIFTNDVLKCGKGQKIDLSLLKRSGLSKERKNKNTLKLFKEFISSKYFTIEGETIGNQLSEIIALADKGITLKDLIEKDVTHLQLLYAFWVFILRKREIDRTNKKQSIGKINNIYGLTEEIIRSNEDDLKKSGVNINPDGRVHNMSVKNIGSYIESYFHSFSKGTIDLKKSKFTRYTSLYLSPKGDKSDFQECKLYIESAIKKCIGLLSNKKVDEKDSYVILLRKNGIIGKEGTSLTDSQKNNITDLIEYLKVVYGKLEPLEYMLKIAGNDSASVYNELSVLFDNQGDKDQRVSDSMGPTKEYGRSLAKLISKYFGDFTKLGDLTRLKTKKDTISGLNNKFIDFIELAKKSDKIIDIGFENRAGHPFSLPRKLSGYRDLKVLCTLESGNIVELQFHYTKMLEAKTIGLEIDESFLEKVIREGMLLDEAELISFAELLALSKKSNSKININLLSNISGKTNEEIQNIKELEGLYSNNGGISTLSGDLLYKISRGLDKKSPLIKKLKGIERIIFNTAWSYVVNEYIGTLNN